MLSSEQALGPGSMSDVGDREGRRLSRRDGGGAGHHSGLFSLLVGPWRLHPRKEQRDRLRNEEMVAAAGQARRQEYLAQRALEQRFPRPH